MSKEQTASLRAMSALSDTPVNIREVIDDWVLITFDIPTTEEGNKVRSEFYKVARRVGALQHTESVYLMPLTTETEMLALELSRIGNVFIWTSTPAENEARGITDNYDDIVDSQIDDVFGRIQKTKKLYADEKDALANKMAKKTNRLIDEIEGIAQRRGLPRLQERVEKLKEEAGGVVMSPRLQALASLLKKAPSDS